MHDQWLPAASYTIPVRNNNLREETLQPARRSNPQAVVKLVTAPNQTARSFLLYIIIIIDASTITLSHHHTYFVLLQTSPIFLVDKLIFNL